MYNLTILRQYQSSISRISRAVSVKLSVAIRFIAADWKCYAKVRKKIVISRGSVRIWMPSVILCFAWGGGKGRYGLLGALANHSVRHLTSCWLRAKVIIRKHTFFRGSGTEGGEKKCSGLKDSPRLRSSFHLKRCAVCSLQEYIQDILKSRGACKQHHMLLVI